jgi:hypothetical protein
MESKYKVGLLQINLLIAALLTAWQALYSQQGIDAILLWMATLWLSVTASQVATPHRRPVTAPWQLLPGLLLAALLWASPERHLAWLWAWAVLIMLPQPRWMMLLNLLLAIVSWALLLELIGFEQWALSGILLVLLMMLGLSRSLELQALRRGIRYRARLLPKLSLWPAAQLHRDLQQERRRVKEEQSHGELMMVRARRFRIWSLAESLCRQARPFERCYRIDRFTLGLMLISPDADSAALRRQTVQNKLPRRLAVRVVPLDQLGSLDDECRRLKTANRMADSREVLAHG